MIIKRVSRASWKKPIEAVQVGVQKYILYLKQSILLIALSPIE